MDDGLGQFHAAEGSINLALGHPAPALLPAELFADTARAAIRRYGHGSLDYGAGPGPRPMLEQVRGRLADIDARVPALDEILITSGTSAGIDQVATLMTRPGDVVLVESPTYHLALRIFSDHPVGLEPVPCDAEGIDVDAVVAAARRLRAAGRTVRLVYSVPTFANPTGVSISAARRRALAQALVAEDLVLVEDDAYRELPYDGAPPPSVWSEAAPGAVIRLGSFSKSLAPGVRLGYVTASGEIVERFLNSGLVDSGGGTAHLSAIIVSEFMASGAYAANVEQLRAAYRLRRDALVEGVRTHLPQAQFRVPAGGYFLWLTLPGADTGPLLAAADAVGVRFVPGQRFSTEPGKGASSLRLAFSYYEPADLAEGTRRIAQALAGV